MYEAFLVVKAEKFGHNIDIIKQLNELKKHNSPSIREIHNTDWDVLAIITYGSYAELKEFVSILKKLEYVGNVIPLTLSNLPLYLK